MGIADPIFEPNPCSFEKLYIFWRETNDITSFFDNSNHKSTIYEKQNFVFSFTPPDERFYSTRRKIFRLVE